MLSVFARPKPCRIMILLRDNETQWHLSKIAKNSDTTYVYVTGLIRKLEKAGFLTIEPKGKKRIVKLTEKGIKVANTINELENVLEN